jgi:exodeoxyribonuclease-3
MKIATWNVNSINVRMPQLLGWFETADLDVLCLQETKTVDENFPTLELKAAWIRLGFHGTEVLQRRRPLFRSTRS